MQEPPFPLQTQGLNSTVCVQLPGQSAWGMPAFRGLDYEDLPVGEGDGKRTQTLPPGLRPAGSMLGTLKLDEVQQPGQAASVVPAHALPLGRPRSSPRSRSLIGVSGHPRCTPSNPAAASSHPIRAASVPFPSPPPPHRRQTCSAPPSKHRCLPRSPGTRGPQLLTLHPGQMPYLREQNERGDSQRVRSHCATFP